VFLCVHKHSKALAETFSTDALTLQRRILGGYRRQETRGRTVTSLSSMDCPTWIRGEPLTACSQHTDLRTHVAESEHSQEGYHSRQRSSCSGTYRHRWYRRSIAFVVGAWIDEQGRCPVSDVYIMLPKHWQGDAILVDLQSTCRGSRWAHWDYEPDGPKVYAPRSSSAKRSNNFSHARPRAGADTIPVYSATAIA